MALTPEGRSLVPLLANPGARPWRQRVFGEFLGTSLSWTATAVPLGFKMVRTGPDDATAPNDSYIVWNTGPQEYYDLDGDPYQLTSRHDDPRTAPREHIFEGSSANSRPVLGVGVSL